MAWFAAWSAVSAASSGEVPGGLTDSSLDWDNATSPLFGLDRYASNNSRQPENGAA
jgi:hypothetical protein